MLTRVYNICYDIKETLKGKEGQGMVEYALIIGLVAVLLVVALTTLRTDIENVFNQITGAI